MSDARLLLAKTLRENVSQIQETSVVSGFDGFVDQLISVVEERQNLNSFTPVNSMTRFSELIGQAAGRSSLREIVVNSTAAGGCAVNLGDGLNKLGVKLDYFGTIGSPPHPAFDTFRSECRSATAWGSEPGMTMALEFQDGKYMLSSVTQLADFNPQLLDTVLQNGSFLEACTKAEAIALTNWSLYPHMTECWEILQNRVFDQLEHRPWIFIDLVDPRSRSAKDIDCMLETLTKFQHSGRCILGGNLNEANVLCERLSLPRIEKEGPELTEHLVPLREKLGISEIAIHCIAGAATAAEDGTAWIEGPYTPTPKKSTGAGDRYNAGYLLGRTLGLDLNQSCLLGSASSGFFVRNARSGSVEEISNLLENWSKNELTD
ncbi:carbohydrate kinase [Pelagicoccus mobilis]|uniref:Carbohydrate kinase n=1 Tax=Pelagicoccus mobilis TaxID=415221 RepID=A0A934RUR0_9BACT|nr:carbohydrate kinase [Pelagicoccus mobilis]MBK1875489.1 carbohydrate kinase [Pelagicoccus mobilis]